MNSCLFEDTFTTYRDFTTETGRTLKSGMHMFSKTCLGPPQNSRRQNRREASSILRPQKYLAVP